VSEFTKISEGSLRKFEGGEKDPSFLQLEKLGGLYNVKPLTFFERDTPDFDATLPDFRRELPTAANVSPRGLKRIWDIDNRSVFTKALIVALGADLPKLPSFSRLTNKLAPSPEALREAFDTWQARVNKQLKFPTETPEGVFKYIRLFIDRSGCSTSVNSAPVDDYLGFFKVSAKNRKSIFVNREIRNPKRSLFTLIHELAHLLHDEEGISNPFIAKNDTEKLSNKFAAEFLAPTQAVENLVRQYSSSTLADYARLISAVSRDTLLSRQAAALRLNSLGHISKKQTSEFFAVFSKTRREISSPTAPEKVIMGRSVVIGKRLSEVGVFPAYVASVAIEKKIVDFVDIERGLGVGQSIQSDLLALARRRFEASLD
jgi:Zn-dependent peptidase ImmA (M78 family)